MKTLIRTMVSVGVQMLLFGTKLVSRMLMFMNLRSLRSHLFWCVPIFFGAFFSFDSHGGHHRMRSQIEALLKRDPTHHQEAPESPERIFILIFSSLHFVTEFQHLKSSPPTKR